MKNFIKTHYKKIIIVIVLLVLIIVAVLFILSKKTNNNGGQSFQNRSQNQITSENSKKEPPKNCKSNPNPEFTSAFTDLTKVASIGPIGTLTGGSPARSYIVAKEELPIYAPIDATLERIVYANRGDPSVPAEYGLQFRVSCEVTFMFDHMDRVTDELKEISPKEPAPRTNGGTYPNVTIKAGTLLGYSDGTSLAKTWDFFLLNSAKPPKYINPKRWTWDQTVTAGCPYDYFTVNLKDQYYNKLGYGGGKYPFFKAEGCGSPSRDVAGTIAGGWFQGDGTDSKGKNLNVASYIGTPQFNIRENFEKTINFSDWDSKVMPESIVVGQSVCYSDRQSSNKWAYLKLISENQLLSATGDGKCPSEFPTTKAETWER